MWEFVARTPSLEAVAILPGLVLGAPYCGAHLKSSLSVVQDVVNRTYPGYPPLWYNLVDAEAVAQAHLQAATRDEAVGQRYLVSHEGMWWIDIAERLAAHYHVPRRTLPRWMLRLAAITDPRVNWAVLRQQLDRPMQTDASRVVSQLGIAFQPTDDCLRETAAALVAGGHAPKAKVRARA